MAKIFVVFVLAFGFGCVSSYDSERNREPVQPNEAFVRPISNDAQFPSVNGNKEPIPTPKTGRFFIATSKSDQEVVDFFNRFRRSVENGDKTTIATMIGYPVCVRFAHGDENRKRCRLLNRASFLKNYDNIFDNDYKQFISGIDTDKVGQLGVLWANWRGVTADRGQFWIEGICRDSKCVESKMKITILSSGLLQRPYDPRNHVDSN